LTPGPTSRSIGLFCAIAVLWLATRRYLGVIQDARFYIVEALRGLDPTNFAHDLYFQFGSQGSFSLFPKFYLPLLPIFGVGVTGLLLTVVGQALWIFSLACLARTLVGGRYQLLSIALVIGMLNIYAPYFGYGEAFVTARLFAEALTMLALALLPTRTLWSLALLGLSAAIHPLMTLPGLAVAFVYLALGQPVWWAIAAAGAGCVAALALLGIPPFANLFKEMDPAWFAIVKAHTIQCFITRWSPRNFATALAALAWAVAALFAAGEQHRRFLMAVLVVGVGGVLCALLGGDILHNVFVIEIQPWRSLWLLQLVSRIYIPLVLAAVLARTRFGSFQTTTLLTLGLILLASVTRLVRYANSAEFTPLSLALVAGALAVLLVHLSLPQFRYPRIANVATALGAMFLLASLWQWDGRTTWTKFLESPTPPPKELAALLPPKASVYWEDNIEMLWLKMKRASYFSCDQGTGMVFYRDIAMAYRHRSDSFSSLNVSDFHLSDGCKGLGTPPKPQRDRAGLQKLCRQEPGLDYVILASPLEGIQPRIWKSPIPFEDVRMTDGIYFALSTDRFYVYSCSAVR
jgi:hypothetical protein